MKNRVLTLIVAAAVCVAGICAAVFIRQTNAAAGDVPESEKSRINPDAFVYVLNWGITCGESSDYLRINYRGLTDGFAVGNGRYVVTAAHCLTSFGNTPFVLRQPIVVSPYYGDLFEARIAAVDETNDVAVLEVDWDAHPALELETGEQWKTGKTIEITGYPPPAAERGGSGLFSRNIMVEATRLRGTSEDGSLSILWLGPVNRPGKGWSGSPFINPLTGKVVGVLTQKRHRKKWFILKDDLIFGCSADAIRNLLAGAQLQEGAVSEFTPVSGAPERFDRILAALDSVVHLKKDQGEAADKLCEEIPSSSMACLLASGFVGSEEAEPYLLKAIEVDPDSSLLRANYGRRLMALDQFSRAAEQFQAVIDREPDHLFANYGLLASLGRLNLRKAEALGKDLTERWPENRMFWYEYSDILKARKKPAEQLAAIRKAIDLCSDVPHYYQRRLADALAANRHQEESEQAFRELLKTHECENCWRAYAGLLAQMGPDQAALAEEALAKADTFKSEQAAESHTEKGAANLTLQSFTNATELTADEQGAE